MARRLERWRRYGKPPSPIPEALWTAAVELAQEYGPSRTARLLRLSYGSLKKRLEAESGKQASTPPEKVSPAFVEVGGSMAGPWCQCTVELDHPGGAKMRLELKGAGAPELEALVTSFWSAAR